MPLRTSLILLLLLAVNVQATEKTLPLWELGAGAAAIRFPDYRGSSDTQNYLLPIPAFIYRGEKLKVDRKGLRGLLFDSDRVLLDISLDGAVPVDSDQNSVREGMPDLDATFELGPSLKTILYDDDTVELRFNLPYRYVYSTDFTHLDSRGTLFHPNLSFDYTGTWHFGARAGPLYGSFDYHNYYFSVPPEYVTTERPAYKASGGFSGIRYTLGFSRRYGKFMFGGFIRYDDLGNAVFRDSPLVVRENTWMGGLSFAWFFKQSARMVHVEDDTDY